MLIEVSQVPFVAIAPMRDEYRLEMACQIVHDSYHERGFTDSYVLRVDGEVVGYGSASGTRGKPDRVLKEFYVRPPHRGAAVDLCRQLVQESDARSIEAQTNDRLLSLMLFDFACELTSDTVVFDDAVTTTLSADGVAFRKLGWLERKQVFEHKVEPVGDWGLDHEGTIVATGGLFFHYNRPYGDIYMEVVEPYRRRGFGSYLVQELKRVCREQDSVPAARCNRENVASRRTLQRAGMFPCARIVRGTLPADGGSALSPVSGGSCRG